MLHVGGSHLWILALIGAFDCKLSKVFNEELEGLSDEDWRRTLDLADFLVGLHDLLDAVLKE